MAVECKKPLLDIAYGFPVIVMRRVGPPKKLPCLKTNKTILGFLTSTEYDNLCSAEESKTQIVNLPKNAIFLKNIDF